jgi:hypothetical protein
MKYIWSITADDYLEIIELAKKHGKKEGDSMEDELIEVMESKGKKALGATELTLNELAQEYASKGKSILSVEHDSQGQASYKVTKKDEKSAGY